MKISLMFPHQVVEIQAIACLAFRSSRDTMNLREYISLLPVCRIPSRCCRDRILVPKASWQPRKVQHYVHVGHIASHHHQVGFVHHGSSLEDITQGSGIYIYGNSVALPQQPAQVKQSLT